MPGLGLDGGRGWRYVDKEVGELGEGDVEELLREYKEMAGLLEKMGVRRGEGIDAVVSQAT